jgi:sugar lactone lactonase YvrE
MHQFHRRGLTVAAILAVTGCSGASTSQLPVASTNPALGAVRPGVNFLPPLPQLPVRPQSQTKYPTGASLVFESDQLQAAVNIYQTKKLPGNPSPIATISVQKGCPYGLASDSGGTLYVADNCGGSDVELYPKGSTKMSTSITNGISNPLGLAIDKTDTLYVSNYPASITEYPKGASSPSKTITGGGLTNPFGLAIDSRGNLYIADFGADAIFEVKAGSSTVTNLNLQGIGSPTGLAIDQKKDVLWETSSNTNVISLYHLTSKTKTPFEVIGGQGEPYAIAIQNRGGPLREVVESDLSTDAVYAYKPYTYTSYATLTNGISLPTGLLISKP